MGFPIQTTLIDTASIPNLGNVEFDFSPGMMSGPPSGVYYRYDSRHMNQSTCIVTTLQDRLLLCAQPSALCADKPLYRAYQRHT